MKNRLMVGIAMVAFCAAIVPMGQARAELYVKKKEEQAEPTPEEQQAMSDQDRVVSIHVGDIAQTCPGAWHKQVCLSSLSNSVMSMVSQYAEALQNAGQEESLTPLKEHCAAATAATQIEVPAHAMVSALTECVNAVYDITEATTVKPHLMHYRLTIDTIFCLKGEPQCLSLEKQLIAVRAQ